MKTFEPMDHKATGLDIRLRTVLSSWKKGRGFHSVASSTIVNGLVLHSSKTELNREYGKRGAASWGWFFFALFFLAAIDYFYLHSWRG